MPHTNNVHRLKTVILLPLVFGLLASCDCVQRLQGYVIDAETGQPLSAVFYSRDSLLAETEKQNRRIDTVFRHQWQTDSTGWFMDMRLADGFSCKPHLILWFDKDGYKPVQLEWQRNKSNLDTLVIKLHK